MRKIALLVAAVFTVAAVGCGGGGTEEAGGASSQSTETAVTVEISNGSLTIDPASVPAGTVTLEIDPEAGEAGDAAHVHALTILKTDLPPDGLSIGMYGRAETTKEGIEIAYSESVASSPHSAEVELEPGSYILLCNYPLHYGRGERAGLEVT